MRNSEYTNVGVNQFFLVLCCTNHYHIVIYSHAILINGIAHPNQFEFIIEHLVTKETSCNIVKCYCNKSNQVKTCGNKSLFLIYVIDIRYDWPE